MRDHAAFRKKTPRQPVLTYIIVSKTGQYSPYFLFDLAKNASAALHMFCDDAGRKKHAGIDLASHTAWLRQTVPPAIVVANL